MKDYKKPINRTPTCQTKQDRRARLLAHSLTHSLARTRLHLHTYLHSTTARETLDSIEQGYVRERMPEAHDKKEGGKKGGRGGG